MMKEDIKETRWNELMESILKIEREGINSWATMVGYSLYLSELNNIGKEIGKEKWIDIRKRQAGKPR